MGAETLQRDNNGWWRPWRDVHTHVTHLEIDYSAEELERSILAIVEDQGFNWTVFAVAGSGFLASSYSLFATNVISPSLEYLYPDKKRLGEDPSLTIDIITLVGTILGMVIMGHLSDRSGRKKWYGVELLTIIFASLGTTQASEMMMLPGEGTYRNSGNIYAWIAWWRFVLGFGIGAEYPLSAVISAEWTPTKTRGTMLASVFLFQSVGRLLAFGVSFGILRRTVIASGVRPGADDDTMKLVIDRTWRWVVGIGLIPACIAVLLRLTIPETPRYHAHISKNPQKAVHNAMKVYGWNTDVTETNIPHGYPSMSRSSGSGDEKGGWYRGAWQYLWGPHQGWTRLACISLLWLIMDICFYGLALDSPDALATLMQNPQTHRPVSLFGYENPPHAPCPPGSPKAGGGYICNATVYHILQQNSLRAMIITSVAAMAGSLVVIAIINRFRRRYIMIWGFLLLSTLFIAAGVSLMVTRNGENHIATVVFYAITQFAFNAGPNTIIFVMAAEIFPTVYRGTFNGISAASGKVGAIIIRIVVSLVGNDDQPLSYRLLACLPFLLLSAWLSCYLPDVQVLSRQGDDDQEEAQSGDESPLDETGSINPADSVHTRRRQAGFLRFLAPLKNLSLEQIAPNPH